MKRILLIEDNLEIRENIQELLELEGYTVITAINGQIGFDLASEERPHLILCDIRMPEMDGYEVFKKLKENSATAPIPFVFITASVEKSEVQKALNLGATGYIRKPFAPNELLDTVERHIKQNFE